MKNIASFVSPMCWPPVFTSKQITVLNFKELKLRFAYRYQYLCQAVTYDTHFISPTTTKRDHSILPYYPSLSVIFEAPKPCAV